MELSEVIIEKIKREGPISFHDFMEMALYYPGIGYYTSPSEKFGKEGDFCTSCNISSAFGATVAKQLEEIWNILGTETFTIVEYGAGTGSLCNDVLAHFKKDKKRFDNIHYCIIERSSTLRDKEQKQVSGNVSWYDSILELGEVDGCIISNELLDNFAVHQVEMQDELMEIFVDYQNNSLKEDLKPASYQLRNYLQQLNINLPKGFRTEINLEVKDWLKDIAQTLRKGYIITMDYGFQSSAFYANHRSNGTLLCYYRHSISENVFENIGRQDITSHVNFSALQYWGKQMGLQDCGFTNQANFLLALGFKDYFRKMPEPGTNIMQIALEEARVTRTLLLDLGLKIKVLVQKKGVKEKNLTGLRHQEEIISV